MKRIILQLFYYLVSAFSQNKLARQWKIHLGLVLLGVVSGLSSCHSVKKTCYSAIISDSTEVIQPKCYERVAEPDSMNIQPHDDNPIPSDKPMLP